MSTARPGQAPIQRGYRSRYAETRARQGSRTAFGYERNASHFLAFLTSAATITCYGKLTKHAM